MFRPLRPLFETLEKREVFSGVPLVEIQAFSATAGAGSPLPNESISFNFAAVSGGREAAGGSPVTGNTAANGTFAVANTAPWSNGLTDFGPTHSMNLFGDSNGDHTVDALDLAIKSPGDIASGQPTNIGNQVLPYIEQDNFYRSSDTAAIDVVFDRDMAAAVDAIFQQLGMQSGGVSTIQPAAWKLEFYDGMFDTVVSPTDPAPQAVMAEWTRTDYLLSQWNRANRLNTSDNEPLVLAAEGDDTDQINFSDDIWIDVDDGSPHWVYHAKTGDVYGPWLGSWDANGGGGDQSSDDGGNGGGFWRRLFGGGKNK
jgi:hypothetical protein